MQERVEGISAELSNTETAPKYELGRANVLRLWLLAPFSLLYGLMIWVRHCLFDWKILPSTSYPIPVLCIGNLEAGGSGKTPMADWIINEFSSKYKIAYLSRGYERSSRGSVIANEHSTPEQIGDEPFLIFQRWKAGIKVVVDGNRRRGVELIRKNFPDVNLIVLDDGYQHRYLTPRVSVLLTSWSRPFFNNYLLPSGTLRDVQSRYKQATAFIFTKACQADAGSLALTTQEWKNNGLIEKPLFVSTVQYETPINGSGDVLNNGQRVILVAGLADNRPFFSYASGRFEAIKTISKPDHYRYSPNFFREYSLENYPILTTEKDFYKLLAFAPDPKQIYYLPIKIDIYPKQLFIETIESRF